jgi:hypothetical protein
MPIHNRPQGHYSRRRRRSSGLSDFFAATCGVPGPTRRAVEARFVKPLARVRHSISEREGG